jgi:hypothetical protein
MGLGYQSDKHKYRQRFVGIWLEVDVPVMVVVEGVLVIVLEVVLVGFLRRLRGFRYGGLFWDLFRCFRCF